MITYWKYDTRYVQVDEWQPGCWIRVSNPTAEELELLESRWQVPLDEVHDANDADERPRLKPLQYLRRMPRPAQRAVQIHPVRANPQPVQALVQQDGKVVKTHSLLLKEIEN